MKKMTKILKILFTLFFIIGIASYSFHLEVISASEVYPFNGIVLVDTAVVHNAPNTKNESAFTELAYGTRVTVTGISGSLYKITYDGSKSGYVAKSLILNLDANMTTSNIVGVETYSDYCTILKNAGFHESYCPYLYYIHGKHPTWVFKADVINHTIDEVSAGEVGKCSLQTENMNYWISTDSTIAKNESNYYFVKSSVIASYMDPRNSLFEETIFQFLDSDDTKDLSSDNTLNYIVSEGNLKQYLDIFKQAATVQGINVVQLVSRSKQEGNNTFGYGPTTGTYTTDNGITYQDKTLDGFYNFYNIGAYKADGLDPIPRGIAYAAGYFGSNTYGRPWDTPEKAIMGGADYLANAYIRKGQDTPYYQKFNVSSYTKGNLYTNQYMTNIYAPASEGKTVKNTYTNSGELEQPFIFTIPVYSNMTSSIYQAVNKNFNSKLSSIKVNGTLITGFDKDVTEYNYNLTTDSNTFTISATTDDQFAKVSGTGTITFINGISTVNLLVTAEDGSTTTYKVTVKQIKITPQEIKANEIVSKMAVKINGNIMYGVSPGTQVSTLVSTITKNGGTAVVVDSNEKSKTTGNLSTGDKITIKGTNDSLSYVIAVRGDINGDGLVKINDLILLQSHILEKVKLVNEKFYAADINYDGNLKINDLILVQSNILGKVSL